MIRDEQIRQEINLQLAGSFGNYSEGYEEGFIAGAKWADKTMIDKALRLVKNSFFGSFGKDLANNIADEFVKAMKED